jgi:hypothetical protein
MNSSLNKWQEFCDEGKRTLLANTCLRRLKAGERLPSCDLCGGMVCDDAWGGFRCTNCSRSFQPAKSNP